MSSVGLLSDGTQDTYGSMVGLVYIFNLIVGTGALTMPKGFNDAGWFLSTIIIITLCLMSYITVTFVIEAMSIANATIKIVRRDSVRRQSEIENVENSTKKRIASIKLSSISSDDSNPKPNDLSVTSKVRNGSLKYGSTPFEITKRVEMGKMARMFFSENGTIIFFICIAVYLYGDLAIYAAAIGKSLRDITCSQANKTCGNSSNPLSSDICWESVDISRGFAYRIYVGLVLIVLGPFTFFNVQKTKYLQILTTLFRWIAFITMIIMATIALVSGHGRGKPSVINMIEIPNLFGICVYSFMCHHSLPALITPIAKKDQIFRLVGFDYGLILAFYLLLSFTGAFTFDKLQDIYTLNFQKDSCSMGTDHEIIPHVTFLEYFLPLFPVFTLSTSFPIIAISLCNNLKTIFMSKHKNENTEEVPDKRSRMLNRILYPLLAVIPPILIALATDDLEILVGIVGSYAGVSIQYMIPAALVYYARKSIIKRNENNEIIFDENEASIRKAYSSPFLHSYWIYFVILWSILCIIFVTVNNVIKYFVK